MKAIMVFSMPNIPRRQNEAMEEKRLKNDYYGRKIKNGILYHITVFQL